MTGVPESEICWTMSTQKCLKACRDRKCPFTMAMSEIDEVFQLCSFDEFQKRDDKWVAVPVMVRDALRLAASRCWSTFAGSSMMESEMAAMMLANCKSESL